MGALRPVHILLVVIVLLLLFGARRLPDLAQSVGQSLKIFKNEVKELRDDAETSPVAAAPTARAVDDGATPPDPSRG